MKVKLIVGIVSYVFVMVVVLCSKTSEGYDEWIWKGLLGQVFAIPYGVLMYLCTGFWLKIREYEKEFRGDARNDLFDDK